MLARYEAKTPLRRFRDSLAIKIFGEMYKRGLILAL